jgi:hypothetical protein
MALVTLVGGGLGRGCLFIGWFGPCGLASAVFPGRGF